MEQLGQLFFTSFIDWVWAWRWLIGLFFGIFVVRELWRLSAGERWHALLMFCYFFLIISTYWLIKPIKKALFVGYYQESGWTFLGTHFNAAQVELFAKEINLLLAILAAWFFVKLASYVKREKLALSIIALFAVGFFLFVLLFDQPGVLTRWMFYFYGDFFATLMIAGFFAFLNDSGDSQMAKRLYGLIGLGGVLGGFFGSAVVAVYAKRLEPSYVAMIAIGALAVMAMTAWLAGKHIRPAFREEAQRTDVSTGGASVGRDAVNLFRSSPYLIDIALVVGLYEMVSTIMDYQFTASILHFIPGEQLGGYFSSVFAFTNLVALLLQLFLARIVLVHLGATKGLLILPVVALFGEIGFVLLPGLLIGSLLNTIDNAFAYSINQSSKEALYVPLASRQKYIGKGVIDIFILRSSKAIAGILGLLLTMFFTTFEDMRWLSLIVLGLLIGWLMVIRHIHPLYHKMVRSPIEPSTDKNGG